MAAPEPVSAEERRAVHDAARLSAPDRTLAAKLAPPAARDDLLALAAYLGEAARIARSTSEPTLGLVRLAWWRGAIEDGYDGGRTGSPIADALLDAARRHGVARDLLLMPLDGRARELEADGLADEAAFGSYLAETEGAALRLSLAMLGIAATDETGRLLQYAAGALGAVEAARALPLHLAHGRLPLPPERLRAGDPRLLSPAEARGAMAGLVQRLAEEARGDLALARITARGAPPAMLPALLPLALVGPYLQALQSPGRDPLRGVADISPLTRVFRLWVARRRGRF